jgi:Glyoxalase-like domain
MVVQLKQVHAPQRGVTDTCLENKPEQRLAGGGVHEQVRMAELIAGSLDGSQRGGDCITAHDRVIGGRVAQDDIGGQLPHSGLEVPGPGCGEEALGCVHVLDRRFMLRQGPLRGPHINVYGRPAIPMIGDQAPPASSAHSRSATSGRIARSGVRSHGPRDVTHHGVVSDGGDLPIGWIREIVLDSADPWELATFWAGLLHATPVQWYPGWVPLEPPPHGQRLSFQGVARAGKSSAARRGAGLTIHFDVLVSDLAAAHGRVIASGGQFVEERISPRPGPGGEPIPWRVYQDPAGHPFCLVIR